MTPTAPGPPQQGTAPEGTAGKDVDRGGGVLAAPAAILILALILMVGLGVDAVRKAQQIATADAVAEEAARAGGQALDPTALRQGRVQLDTARARAAAADHLAAAGVRGTATLVAPDRIRVEVTTSRPTVLLGLIGVDDLTTTGSAEAEAVTIPAGGPR
jgi:hypothetical protein